MVSPLLSNMEIVEKICTHGGTSVYVVQSTKTKTQYILKHISVPESQRQIDALRYTGALSTDEEVQDYYKQLVSDQTAELELLEKLASSPNLACYRSYQIEPKENEIGYDMYLLCEKRTTLSEIMAQNSMTHLSAVNLGLDLCAALGDLREAGLLHRNVKPSNVYLNEQGHFMLGDLGVARIEELKYCSIPEHMISSYSAPELFDLVGSINTTVDLYSVGLILYRIFNGNHGPFEDEQTSARAADKRRITGEELPAPMYADYEMTAIVKKACALKPEERYQTPEELKQELTEYIRRNQVEDTPIVPPIVVDEEAPVLVEQEEEETVEPVQFTDAEELPDDFKESFSPDTQMLNAIIDSVHKDMEKQAAKSSAEEPAQDDPAEASDRKKPQKKKKRRWIPVVAGIVGALLLAAAVYFFVIRPASVNISGIEVLKVGSTAITVQVDSREKDGAFSVVCSDAYGNSYEQDFVKGRSNTFDQLAPGTQYVITVKPASDKKVSGDSLIRVSTVTRTEILSFTATSIALTQVELNLTLTGNEPESWTVEYGAPGVDPQSVTFAGHSVTIGNLQSNAEYTFVLQQPENTELVGQTSVTYSTVPTVDIEKTTVALSSTKAIISWTIQGQPPEYWTVRVKGADGSEFEQTVTETSVTLEDLKSGMEYTVTISAPTMLQDGVLTVTPKVISISDLKVEENEDGDFVISWKHAEGQEIDGWKLSCTPKGAPKEAGITAELKDVESYTVERTLLVPNTTYVVTVELANGDLLDGTTSVEFAAPEEEEFRDHGFEQGILVLYAEPEEENWKAINLNLPKTSFAPAEKIAFALQTMTKPEQSGDTVRITAVLRNADGTVADVQTTEAVWDDMWDGDLFVGTFPHAPKAAGEYTAQMYFNAKNAAKTQLRVENAAQ